MQDKDLFEYAVIRIVPKVEREEFLNTGVIVYCAKQQFLQAKIIVDKERLQLFCKELDRTEVENNLEAIKRICVGGTNAGPIGMLDLASRFRWLTATRSTVVQTSKVHPGLCTNAKEILEKLVEQLVN